MAKRSVLNEEIGIGSISAAWSASRTHPHVRGTQVQLIKLKLGINHCQCHSRCVGVREPCEGQQTTRAIARAVTCQEREVFCQRKLTAQVLTNDGFDRQRRPASPTQARRSGTGTTARRRKHRRRGSRHLHERRMSGQPVRRTGSVVRPGRCPPGCRLARRNASRRSCGLRPVGECCSRHWRMARFCCLSPTFIAIACRLGERMVLRQAVASKELYQ